MNREQLIGDLEEATTALNRALATLKEPPHPAPLAPTHTGPFALCVGHSRQGDMGAISVDGTDEWSYNREVALILADKLRASGIEPLVYDRYGGHSGYTQAIDWLALKLRQTKAAGAIELHFNSFDGNANEEEYIHYGPSERGRELATAIWTAHQRHDPDNHTRGVKARTTGRAAYALKTTPCPFVICEPFFGDHQGDWSQWGDQQERLATIYHDGIVSWMG